MRFLPSHKTAAINHTCGNPPTYHVLTYLPKLDRWICSHCKRFV